MKGNFLKAEREYYSDHAREQMTAECEWHPGSSRSGCVECEAAYDHYCEMRGDMDREDRAFGRD